MSPTEFASRLLSKPYELIFKEQLEQRTAEFFLSTSYVAVGTLFGSALTFIFLIIGAHILGPQGFGDLSLLLSIGPIVAISMGLNLVATVNYASGAPDDSARTRILSTASIEALLLVTASTTILALLSPQLSYLLGVSAAVFIFAVAYGVAVTCFMLAMNALRVLFSMKAYALSNAAQSVVCLALFLALVTDGMKSWQSAAYALSASNLAVSLIVIFYVRAHLTRQFDWHWARVIMRYSFFAAPGLIAVALMGLDRLLINIFMTTAAVGLYNAYFLSSITVAAGLWGIINATFFPYASRSTDKLALLLKINKVVPYFGVVLVPLIVCAEVIAFVFYGHQYLTQPATIILFCTRSSGVCCFSKLHVACGIGRCERSKNECGVQRSCAARADSSGHSVNSAYRHPGRSDHAHFFVSSAYCVSLFTKAILGADLKTSQSSLESHGEQCQREQSEKLKSHDDAAINSN